MLPIVYEGALAFLESEYFSARETMPYRITYDAYDDMTNKLWESADWRKNVFGVKTVTKYNVNAFFFQLIGTRILSFEWTNASTGLVCVFGTDVNNQFLYKQPHSWKGFTFRAK